MPITVDVPDFGSIDFPDEMQPDEIKSVLAKRFPPKQQAGGFVPGTPIQSIDTAPREAMMPESRRTTAGGLPLSVDVGDVSLPGEIHEFATKPAIPLPRFEPGKTVPSAIWRSAANMAISLPEFMETPLGATSAALAPVAPVAMGAAYAAYGGQSTVSQLKQMGEDWPTMTTPEKAASVVDLVGAGAMTIFPAKGALAAHRSRILPKAAEAARESIQEAFSRQEAAKTPADPSKLATEATRAELTPQEASYQAAERAAIDAGHDEGSPVKVVDKFSGENEDVPFARQFMRPTKDGVEVKRDEFIKWLETVPPEQRAEAIKQRVAEEHIHRHVSGEDAGAYWDSLSAVEKLAATRSYLGEWSTEAFQKKYGGDLFSDTQMGHEALRMRLQRLASGTTSEIAEAALKERWKLQGLEALSSTVRKIRETLGTDASKTGLEILGRVEANLDAAKVAIGGQQQDQPAGLRKGEPSTPSLDEYPRIYQRILGEAGLDRSQLDALGVPHPDEVSHPSDYGDIPKRLTRNAPGGYLNRLYDELAPKGQTGRFLWGGTADTPKLGFEADVPGSKPDPTAARQALDAVNKIRNIFGQEPLPDFFGPTAETPAAIRKSRPNEPELPIAAKPWQGDLARAKELTPDAIHRDAYAFIQRENDALEQKLATDPQASVSAPTFNQFFKEAKTKHPGLQRGQLAEVWDRAVGIRLQNASGNAIKALAKALDIKAPERIADPPSRTGQAQQAQEAATVRPGSAIQLPGLRDQFSQSRTALKAQRAAEVLAQQSRQRVSRKLYERLVKPAYPEIATSRPNVNPEDLAYHADSKEPVIWDVSKDDLNDPKLLGAKLAQDASRRPEDARSITKRLTLLVDKTSGKAFLTSTYKEKGKTMVLDPASSSVRAHRQLGEIMARYRPVSSLLLDEPVQSFRQEFKSLADFEDKFGTDARRAAEPSFGELPASHTEAMPEQPKTHLTPIEATAVLDHIMDEAGSLQSSEDVRTLLSDLADPNTQGRMKRDAAAGYSKMAQKIQTDNPTLSNAQILDRLAQQIYETHQNSKTHEDFITRSLAEAGAPRGEVPGAETGQRPEPRPAPGTTGRELTMPINRVPPTTLRPEMVPDFERLVQRGPQRPAPAVPEATPEAARSGDVQRDTPAGIIKSTQAVRDELKAVSADIKALVKNRATEDEILSSQAAASNIPNNIARAEENGVRVQSASKGTFLKPGTQGNPEVLAAANALVQANFARSKMPIFKDQVRRGLERDQQLAQSGSWRERRLAKAGIRNGENLMRELDYAEKHWNDPELQATAKRMQEALKDQLERERAAGIEISEKNGYLPNRYDQQLWNGHSVILNPLSRIWGTRFKEQRSFDSYYEAYGIGPYLAVTRDGASLVGHRVRQGMNMIMRRGWESGLQSVIAPNGKPLAIEAVELKGGGYGTSTRGYVEVQQPHGKPLIIQEDFAKLVKQLTSESPIEDFWLSRNALHLSQKIKHALLIGDFFHMGRMGYYATSLMGKNAGYAGGWSVLDILPRDIPDAIKRGVIRAEDAAWANEKVNYGGVNATRRELVLRAQQLGLNVGMIQDALYKDLVTTLSPTSGNLKRGITRVTDPSVGRYNRFLFDKLTRGLMVESTVREFERQSAKLPEANPDVLLRDIVKDMNNYYGNIGQQGWLKARWQQDVARMLFLAPQWVEGLVKKEAVGYSRLTGLSKLTGQRQGLTALGATGTGIGRGLLFMFGFTQALNLITRKQPTWMNEEEGHKMDAWIPGKGHKEGFWLSPFAIFNELTHDVFRLFETKPKGIEAVQQIIGNKESPLTRAALIAIAGQNPHGEYQTTTGGQLGEAAKALAPTPITFGRYAQFAGHAVAPGMVPAVQPGAMQRQFAGTFGMKIEPAASVAANVSRMAKEFMKREGLEKSTGWMEIQTDEPGYTKMRQALRNGDEAAAKKNYEALIKNRKPQDVAKAMQIWAKRGFTGSKKTERAFLDSLSPQEMAAYSKAQDSKFEELEKFYDFYARQP